MLARTAFRSVLTGRALSAALVAGGLVASCGIALAQAPAAPARPAVPPAPAAQPQAQRPVAAPPKAAAPAPAAPAAQAAPAASGEIVARVAGRDVSLTEVRTLLASLNAEQRAALTKDPAALAQTVRLLLANQLVLKEATDNKWADQPAIAAQLARLREEAIAETYLQSVSIPPANYPDDAEIQRTYDANKSAFIVPRQFRLSQIYVAVPEGADKATEDQARKKLADIQAKLKQPRADFAAVAKEMSDNRESAENGGDLGWLPETQILPDVRKQVAGLAVGAISEPVQVSGGYHIFKLVETKASETRPLAEVRDLLVQRLRQQRAELMRRAYVQRVLEQNPPAINEFALVKALESAPGATAGAAAAR